MRKAVVLGVVVMLLVSLAGCFGPSTHVSRFRITDVRFRWITGTPASVSAHALRETVRGQFTITYVPADATAVAFAYAFGQYPNSQSVKQVEWYDAGSDPDLDGQYIFDTTFTGQNWVTIRGTATTPQGSVVVDHRVVDIDNLPPDVSTNPRNGSVLNTAPAAIVVNVVDGSGADEEGTQVEVTIDGTPLACTRTNAESQIRLVPSSWPDGTYVVTVVPKDVIGNIGDRVTATFTLDRQIQGSPPVVSITGPADGSTVSGTVDLTYSASPDTAQLWLDVAFGREEPLAWREKAEITPINGNGTFAFDTTFTKQNWISVRLFAKGKNGLTAVSIPRTLRVDNPW